MKQNRKSQEKSMQLWAPYILTEGEKYTKKTKPSHFIKWCWSKNSVVLGKLGYYVWKKKIRTLPKPYTKTNSKWSKDLNTRPETLKLLEENTARTPIDRNCSEILYDPPSRTMDIKTKLNEWDLIKLKSFCTVKENIKKMKKTILRMGENNWNNSDWQRLNLQNILKSSCISISEIQPNQKMGRRFKQTFLQRRHRDGQQTHEKMLNSTHY